MTADAVTEQAINSVLERLPPCGTIGLGTGRIAAVFIRALGRVIRAGASYVGVPTSEQSRELAKREGIPLLDDTGPWDIEVTVDGADEVTEGLDLIKGGGACQLREKVVNASSRRNVIVVQEVKLSQHLGEKWPVPVEVIAFGHAATARHLSSWGRVTRREHDGIPRITDSGHFVYDVHTGPMLDPGAVDRALRSIPGVVETGLFIGRADALVIAGSEGVRRLERQRDESTHR